MLSSLIAFPFCLQLAWTCVPVQPGEDMPCPTAPLADAAKDYMTTKPPLSYDKGAKVYMCTDAKHKFLKVDGTTSTALAPGSKIVCEPSSGKYVLYEVGSTTPKQIGNEKFTCGIELAPCQKCDQKQIIDETNAACGTQDPVEKTRLFCDSVPEVNEDNKQCPKLSCDSESELHVIQNSVSSTKVEDQTTVECDAGQWMFAGGVLDPSAIGFVCMKSCLPCNIAVDLLYDKDDDESEQVIVPPTAVKPSCIYGCNAGYNLVVNDLPQEKLVCEATSKKITVNDENGEAANKYKCKECKCNKDQLSAGKGGACPLLSLCTAPTGTLCEAECVSSSTIYYKIPGMDRTETTDTSVKCTLDDKWIKAGVGEVTCKYDPGAGYTEEPPEEPKACARLAEYKCPPGTTCDISNLVYTPSQSGYTAMCKKGSLITNTQDPDAFVANCDFVGWVGGITMANCVTNVEVWAVKDCVGLIEGGGVVSQACAFGSCVVTCVNSDFTYEVNDGTGAVAATNKELECSVGTLADVSGKVEASNVKCV